MAIIGFRGLRDPWMEMERLRSEMDRWLGGEPRRERTQGVLPLRVVEDPEGFVVEAPLPGVDPASVELTVAGDTLTITGERSLPEEAGIARVHRRERWSGRFVRTLGLPDGVDTEKVSAEARDGLLLVRLPSREESLPRKIEVRAD